MCTWSAADLRSQHCGTHETWKNRPLLLVAMWENWCVRFPLYWTACVYDVSVKTDFITFIMIYDHMLNTLKPIRNGHHFADSIFKCIFLIENVWISIKISKKFVPKYPINNIPALIQIIAWRRPMAVRLSTHIWSLGLSEFNVSCKFHNLAPPVICIITLFMTSSIISDFRSRTLWCFHRCSAIQSSYMIYNNQRL